MTKFRSDKTYLSAELELGIEGQADVELTSLFPIDVLCSSGLCRLAHQFVVVPVDLPNRPVVRIGRDQGPPGEEQGHRAQRRRPKGELEPAHHPARPVGHRLTPSFYLYGPSFQTIEKPLRSLVDSITFPPPLVTLIMDSPVSDAWMPAIEQFETILDDIGRRKGRVKAAAEAEKIGDGLRITVSTITPVTRDFRVPLC